MIRLIGVFVGVLLTWLVMTTGIFGGVGPTHNIEVRVAEPLQATCSLDAVSLVPGQAIPVSCTVINPSTQDVVVRLQAVMVPPDPDVVLLSEIDLYEFSVPAGATVVAEYMLLAGAEVAPGTYIMTVNFVILDAPAI